MTDVSNKYEYQSSIGNTSESLPVLVIVFGLPGCGKSFFASRLAESLEATYLNSDRVRKSMLIKRTYSEKEKRAVYDKMKWEMISFLQRKYNVVLDATFYKQEIRTAFLNSAKDKAKVIFIEVQAAEELVRERLEQRRTYSEADFEVYKKIKRQWEPMIDQHLILQSTNQNILDMLRKAEHIIMTQYDTRTNP